METLVIKIEEESKISKVKEFLESMKVSFTSKKKAEKPYNPAFVKMVLEARNGPSIPYTDELRKELFGR